MSTFRSGNGSAARTLRWLLGEPRSVDDNPDVGGGSQRWRRPGRSFTRALASIFGPAIVVAAGSGIAACASDRPAAGNSDGRGDGGAIVVGDAARLDEDGGGLDGSVDGSANHGEAGACLGDAPPAADAGVACSASGPCSEACQRITSSYKAAVARAAIECIAALPSCEVTADVVPCVDQALQRACPDPTSAGFCAPLVTACDPNAGDAGSAISLAGCELFANGLSSAGRTTFAACIEDKINQGTCPAEIASCADSIRQ